MKVLIDIPKEFELDYATDRFAEFFQRCRADMDVCCGKYERETSEMLEKAFAESELYDPDKVVEQLERISDEMHDMILEADNPQYYDGYEDGVDKAIDIVKAGGAHEM